MDKDWLANAYGGMSRREFLAKMGVAGIGLTGFAMAATPVAGKVITTPMDDITVSEGKILSGDFHVPIYEAYPAAAGKYPLILVIPEVFGMHEHIKDVTRRFAKEGFLSVTFEPYAREGGVLHLPDMDAVRKVVNPVPDKRVMADLNAVLTYAKKHPAAHADRIGVTGFCRGGMYTLLFASQNRDVKAAVAWYGQIRPVITKDVRTVGPLDVAALIKVPILGLYGGEDLGIPVSDVKAMEAALKAASETVEFIIYPGAPHAFFADYRPSYRAEAAKDAWHRCIAWFKRNL